MRAFVTPEQMAELDLKTMRQKNISSFELMDLVAEEMFEHFEADPYLAGSVLVLCGPGNNGGDGYRLAEKLRQAGRKVFVHEAIEAKSKDCKKAKRLCKAKKVQGVWPKVDIIVEAIFGSLGRATLDPKISKLLKKANAQKLKRVSLDVPTGIDTKTGRLSKFAFQADQTLCVAFPKDVFIQNKVAECLGSIYFIGDYFVKPRAPSLLAIEPTDFSFRKRARASHKGAFGRCGIVGGSSQMPGAALMAAEAANRVGAGYSSLYFADNKDLKLKIKDASFIFKRKWKWAELKKETALVVGCGGLPKGGMRYSNYAGPTVVDADAIKAWRKPPKSSGPCILTPHPGEAAKLLVTESAQIQKDRIGAVTESVKKTGQAVYLKGAPGLLKFHGDNKCYVNLSINPVFSKAGSGDVLAGIMGGFLAQKPEAFADSVTAALVFQAAVGDVLREQRAAIATDQLEVFSEAFSRLQ
jgi:NAD(P)H-hydrate epimerase